MITFSFNYFFQLNEYPFFSTLSFIILKSPSIIMVDYVSYIFQEIIPLASFLELFL